MFSKMIKLDSALQGLTLCMLGNFSKNCLLIPLKINIFKKIFQEYRLDSDQAHILSGLIKVQAVCKGYQWKHL